MKHLFCCLSYINVARLGNCEFTTRVGITLLMLDNVAIVTIILILVWELNSRQCVNCNINTNVGMVQ